MSFLFSGLPFDAGARGAGEAAYTAEQRATRAEMETNRLRADLERLQLVTHALWTLVREELKLTDEQLAERVRQEDLSDGQLDGRIRAPAGPRPACGRVVGRRLPRCMYCGAVLAPGLP